MDTLPEMKKLMADPLACEPSTDPSYPGIIDPPGARRGHFESGPSSSSQTLKSSETDGPGVK